ncbi:MAG: DNA polymerase III subunit alpha [Enterococcus sp.]
MFFPQLYTKTSYSLLKSTIKINELVQQAKKLGYSYLGISDENILSGTIEFYQACRAAGIHPVIGLSLDYTDLKEEPRQAVFYAKNYQGYQELIKLSSLKMTDGVVSEKDFRETNDLFCLVCPDFSEGASEGAVEAQLDYLGTLMHYFGSENVAVGVTEQVLIEETEQLNKLEQKGVNLCAIQEVLSLQKEQTYALDVATHIQNGTLLEREEIQQLKSHTTERFLHEEKEMVTAFSENGEQALLFAQKVAEECQFELPLHQKLLPHFPVPEQTNAADYLRNLCMEKLLQRVPNITKVYQDRLEYELEIIHTMGFDDYFLIVWDVMAFAHNEKIVTGAGRGSAAGSLVAYVLEITDVDPIKYDLLFERFLNPERYTMPDIDLDIPDNRREDVLTYVHQKYGKQHMAQIATFGTMAAKMVLRDVARVFGLSQSEANRWSKAIPNALKITLEKAYQESPRLRELVQLTPTNQLLFETAKILEGLPRHVSTHAAGVVISDQNLLELVPIQAGSEAIYLTQFTMEAVETIGLLKIDFLGLRNLSIIDNTLKAVKRVENQEIHLREIPLDDAETLRLFQRGETSGVFQFESAGIRNVLRKLSPENIEDIAAVNALYRPGPMQNIDTFIQRKKGNEPITYPDPSLESILANTYGIIVYQEQIMQVASKMAGFTLGQSDILRRAVSKKKKSVLDEERLHFVEGSVAQGYTKEKAETVYDYIERFANYGFNRSHAFAYSFVGFQMAYLKVHHPGAFFAALMNTVRHNTKKLKEYMSEAKKGAIKILGPSINQSMYGFNLVAKEQIRFGLTSIKGVRRDFIQAIIDERKANGAFHSMNDFLARMDERWLKEELLKPLISVGVFDEVESNRRQLLQDLEGKIQNVLYSGGSSSLLDIMELKEEAQTDFSLKERLELEEQYLGAYLSGHPTEGYKYLKLAKRTQQVADIVPNQHVRTLLYIKNIREIRTKKGELMAFVDGSDSSGELTVTCFPNLYRKERALFQEGEVIYVEGKSERSTYNQELQIIAEHVVDPDMIENQQSTKTCYLRITEESDQTDVMKKLSELFQKYPGATPIVLYYEKDKRKIILSETYWIEENPTINKQLSYLLGNDNVVFK